MDNIIKKVQNIMESIKSIPLSESAIGNYRSDFKEIMDFCQKKDLFSFDYEAFDAFMQYQKERMESRQIKQRTYLEKRKAAWILAHYAQINFGMFEPTIVLSFLDHMEIEKHWKISTRNQRLSCIRMFFEYAAMTEPMLYSVYASLKSIPLKKDVNKTMTVDYLTETAVSAIINAPDTTTRLGMRDNFFLALMYDVAARDCEMLSMKKSDLNIDNSTLCLLGKGNKPRIVPVSKKTIELGKRYIALFHAEEDAHMFYSKILSKNAGSVEISSALALNTCEAVFIIIQPWSIPITSMLSLISTHLLFHNSLNSLIIFIFNTSFIIYHCHKPICF